MFRVSVLLFKVLLYPGSGVRVHHWIIESEFIEFRVYSNGKPAGIK